MEATHPAWGQDLPWVTERAVAGTNTGFRCTAPSGRSFSPQDTAWLLLASSTPKAIGETWNTRSRQRHGHLPQSSSSIPIYSCISAFFKIRTYFPNNFASVKQGFQRAQVALASQSSRLRPPTTPASCGARDQSMPAKRSTTWVTSPAPQRTLCSEKPVSLFSFQWP